MKTTFLDVSNEDRTKWEEICPLDEFRVISGSVIPYLLNSVLPEDLTRKYDSVLIAGSATLDGTVYYMANGNRIDYSEVDQMPFGLVFFGNTISGCACIIDHGDWENRTIPQPEDFEKHILESGIASYYPLSELPRESSGKLEDLKINSQHKAFEKLLEILKEDRGE